VDLPVHDLETPTTEEQLRRLIAGEFERPLDLAAGPPLRASLLRLGAEEHVLLLSLHHIVVDLWSMGVLMLEMRALYEAFSRAKPSPLADLPIQYADFAVWERRRLRGEVLEAHLAYWRKQLGDVPPPLELPSDRPRSDHRSFEGARCFFDVPDAIVGPLRALAYGEGATLFMVLLAAFALLLGRRSDCDDVVVQSAVARRNRPEIEGLIGLFADVVALRTDLSGNPGFRELLQRVRRTCLDGYAHEALPHGRLLEELFPGHDRSRSPLSRVSLHFQSVPLPALEMGGLALERLELDGGSAREELELQLFEQPTGLRGVFQYDVELFDSSTIEELARSLNALLAEVVRAPERRVEEFAAPYRSLGGGHGGR
jgi:hypothetical protein